MDRMLFNSDATKLLRELQYLNQNHNQNQSRNSNSPAVTQVTLCLVSCCVGLNVNFGVRFIVNVLEHNSYGEKASSFFVLDELFSQTTSISLSSQAVPEILANSLVISLLGALSEE